uniref:Protein kinase domain-containing protein n=1 Tax=Mesocestoides corti TaxID=53468 RepID=A0A5K3EZU0_MESCO
MSYTKPHQCPLDQLQNTKFHEAQLLRKEVDLSESSLSSSGLSFEDPVSFTDVTNFEQIIKKTSGEACSELSFTQSSSSGFVTGREDGNTSSLLSADTDSQAFTWQRECHPLPKVAPILRNLSDDTSQSVCAQVAIRASFLPYTGSSQYGDDEDEDVIVTGQSSPATISFKPFAYAQSSTVVSITDRPFAKEAAVPPAEELSTLRPRGDEQQTLTVPNLLSTLTLPPSEVDGKVICDVPSQDGHQRRHLEEFLGCFRPFVRLFLRNGDSMSCKSMEEPQWEWPPSQILDLQYVGSGAQGSVYKATLNGRVIAVKKVNKQSETEIRHLRGLCHKNVVQFLGVSIDGPWYSILMEYCPNGTFFDLLHNNLPVNIDNIIDWTRQIAQGMNYLHSHKVVHRDLKSPNILIGEDGELKISDFGVSKEFNENSTKMSFAGTVAWMAPEIMRGEPCSFKVDVWSFGVLVWEILTCEVPFNGVDYGAIIYGVASNIFSLPIPTDCPTEFRVLMKRCWCPKPRNRPSFPQILSQLELAYNELLQWKDENFNSLREFWQEEIHLRLRDLLKEGSRAPRLEISLMRRRRQELKDAQNIRQNYEEKLMRVNQLCSHLKALTEELEKEQQKVAQERSRYKRLIYERSRSNTPFRVDNSAVRSPFPAHRPQSCDSRKREPEAKFTCRKCGAVNFSKRHPAFSLIPLAQKDLHSHCRLKTAIRNPSAGSGNKSPTVNRASRRFRAWYAATRSKLVENASLVRVKLKRFASVGDLQSEYQGDENETCRKSFNAPSDGETAKTAQVPSNTRPDTGETETQHDEQRKGQDARNGMLVNTSGSFSKVTAPKSHPSASEDSLFQQLRTNVSSFHGRGRACSRCSSLTHIKGPQNLAKFTSLPMITVPRSEAVALTALRLKMFFGEEPQNQDALEVPEREPSLSSSSLSSDSDGFNGSRSTVIFQRLQMRPQSGDPYHSRPQPSLSTRVISSEQLRALRLDNVNDSCPPCQRSAMCPTLSMSRHSSPRLRQRPGRRFRSPLIISGTSVQGADAKSAASKSPSLWASENTSVPATAVTTATTTTNQSYLGISVDTNFTSSLSTSPSVTASQMRRSIEKLTIELTDRMTDSLSEKERKVDIFERRFLKVACDRHRRLPAHSVAITGSDREQVEKEPHCGVFFCEKQWLSATDINSVRRLSSETSSTKADGNTMEISSIIDTDSMPTDSDAELF